MNDGTGRAADLEARLRQEASEHEATARSVASKEDELDKARAELASLDSRTMTAMDQLKARVSELEEQLTGTAMLQNQVVDLSGRQAATQAELDDATARFAALEARMREPRADVASLDSKLTIIPRLESELTELKAQIVDRDERLEAWDSRFHASVGELKNEIGTLTAQLQTQDAELHKMRAQLAEAPVAIGLTAAGMVPLVSRSAHRTDDARQLKELLDGLAMRGVQFLPSSAELIPQSLPILERASDAMHRFPDVSVEVAGHTDSWGMPAENLRLSQQRASAVKEYLINCGIAAWRLIEAGYGETRPIDSNETADG